MNNDIKQLAQNFFGFSFSGLNIEICDFSTFQKWYTKRYNTINESQIYLAFAAANYVWENYE